MIQVLWTITTSSMGHLQRETNMETDLDRQVPGEGFAHSHWVLPSWRRICMQPLVPTLLGKALHPSIPTLLEKALQSAIGSYPVGEDLEPSHWFPPCWGRPWTQPQIPILLGKACTQSLVLTQSLWSTTRVNWSHALTSWCSICKVRK